MRILPAKHAAAYLALGIGNGNTPLGAFHKDDEHHYHCHKQDYAYGKEDADVTGPYKLCRLDDAAGNAHDNAAEDDKGYAVAHALVRNLLAKPHDKHGTRTECQHGGDQELRAGMHDNRQPGRAVHLLQAEADAKALHEGDDDGKVTGVLGYLAAPCLSLFLVHAFDFRQDNLQKLHDNRSGDVGHHTQCKDGDVGKTAAGKDIKQGEDGSAHLLEK